MFGRETGFSCGIACHLVYQFWETAVFLRKSSVLCIVLVCVRCFRHRTRWRRCCLKASCVPIDGLSCSWFILSGFHCGSFLGRRSRLLPSSSSEKRQFEVQANAPRLFQSVIHLRQAFGYKRKVGKRLMRCVAPSVCPSSQNVDDGLRGDFLIGQLREVVGSWRPVGHMSPICTGKGLPAASL